MYKYTNKKSQISNSITIYLKIEEHSHQLSNMPKIYIFWLFSGELGDFAFQSMVPREQPQCHCGVS
jgi:hypothetical protein